MTFTDCTKIKTPIDNISTPGFNGAKPTTIEIVEYPKTAGMTGWICPVCGRGLSPWTTQCPCKINPHEVTITY